jgi:transposase
MMRGEKLLSRKEARRVSIIEKLDKGNLTVEEASILLELSGRQTYRLKEAYSKEGMNGLAHKGRGRCAHNRTSDDVRHYIIELATEIAPEASCQHIAEMLEEDKGVKISSKTVGRILKEVGIPLPHGHKSPRGRHPSRERMSSPGLLVQIDASPFQWLGSERGELHLHGAIDDATSNILALWLDRSENCTAYLHVMQSMFERWGVPERLYSDRHGIFFPVNPKPTLEEELEGRSTSLSQFGRIMERLGVVHIKAYSPQAKGRVERLWGTLQHRLVVDLRRKGMTSMREVNAFLPEYIETFNRMFGVRPRNDISSFSPSPSSEELELLMVKEHERKADKGSRISYKGVKYQLTDKWGKIVALKPRSSVHVLIHMDGHLSARKGEEYFSLKEFHERPKMEKEERRETLETSKNPLWNIQGRRRLVIGKGHEGNVVCEWTSV